jgi:NADPH2:quinone reductase
MAVAAGCFVCGTAGSPAGEAAVAAAGAHCVVNHKTDEGYLDKATAALPKGSSGYDVLLENAAHVVRTPPSGWHSL